MKVKVIAEIEDKDREFKVRRMNIDEIIVNYPTGTGLKSYKQDEVELISEGEIADFLINNINFLTIKLNRGISIFFYKALKDSLENEMDEKLNDLNVLRDRYKVNKRGIWEKELICVINNSLPIKVMASGQNFKRDNYSILITPLEIQGFMEGAKEEINKIRKEIKQKEILLSRYGKAINNIKKSEKNEAIYLLSDTE